MDWREVIIKYVDTFEESAGVPFDGFPDEETEMEYLRTLQACIEAGTPMTLEQRKRFFPLEYEDDKDIIR